jgi:hypothetical protein
MAIRDGVWIASWQRPALAGKDGCLSAHARRLLPLTGQAIEETPHLKILS